METLQRAANRGSISTGYDIDNSVKTEADNSEWMQRATGGGNDSNLQKHSISTWVKRTKLGGTQMILSMANIGRVRFDSSNKLQYQFASSGGGALTTTRVFRDTSAWYHIFVVADTTLSTANDRLKIYVNGVRETSFDYNVAPTQNSNSNGWGLYNSYNLNFAGKSDDFYNGYIAETFFIGKQSLLPTDFGEFDDDTGIWKPKEYTGTFGSNDTYLDFKDSSNLGNNAAGGADLSLNNITSADQATDTPTNNFATGNPILYFSTATTVSEGATKIAKGANGWEILASTMAVTKGKWYVEVRNETMPESAMASIMPDDIELIFRGGQTTNYPGKIVGDEGQGYYSYNGKYYRNGGFEDYGASWTGSTNTIGIALDMDNGKLYFAKDNTWQNSGDPTSGATGTGAIDVLAPTKPHLIGYTPYAANTDGFINFGGYTGAAISSAASDENGYGNFEYAPPSGYYALCTKNLAEFG